MTTTGSLPERPRKRLNQNGGPAVRKPMHKQKHHTNYDARSISNVFLNEAKNTNNFEAYLVSFTKNSQFYVLTASAI